MKNILFTLFVIITFCNAQPPNDSIRYNYDSLKIRVDVLGKTVDSLNSKFISDNFISIKAAKETQDLHNKAFDKMQNSFNIFVIAVGIIITAITLISTIFNYNMTNNSRKDLKEELAKIKDFENKIEAAKIDFKTQIEAQIDIQQRLFKEELAKFRMENKLKDNEIWRGMADGRFALAKEHFKNGDMESHFQELAIYLQILYMNNVGLNDLTIGQLEAMKNVAAEYKNVPDGIYLMTLTTFLAYSKNLKEQRYFNMANLIYKQLYNKFGDKIAETINQFILTFKKV